MPENPSSPSGQKTVLAYELATADGKQKANAKQIVKAETALSSLYTYVLRMESPGLQCATTAKSWLDKRVILKITLLEPGQNKPTTIHTACGVVTEVSSGPVELYQDSASSWYEVTIRPALAKACYSRRRKVYAAGTNKEDVLKNLVHLWTGGGTSAGDDCEVSAAAKGRIPDYIQLVQNDESDYNFFCRLLSTWGLCYRWELNTAKNCEVLKVYDALTVDAELSPSSSASDTATEKPTKCMTSRSLGVPSWQLRYGFHSLAAGQRAVQNYGAAFSAENAADVKLSLHDETWDQLKKTSSGYSDLHYLAQHFNDNNAAGAYTYTSQEIKAAAIADLKDIIALQFGAKVTWVRGSENDSADYRLMGWCLQANLKGLRMDFSARAPISASVYCWPLPRPVTLRYNPETRVEELAEETVVAEHPAPRTFMAVVKSEDSYELNGRNLCRVCELNGQEMWVEMGSPFADSRSGFFARPRVNNVLLCLDRGDLSIPLVLSAFYRSADSQLDIPAAQATGKYYTNEAPYTKLKTMDRNTRKWDEKPTADESALTLRNRTHVPDREYTDETNEAAKKAHDRAIPEEDLEFVQRPQNVHTLAEKPKPFSQIQMISRDNGVRPVDHNDDYGRCYTAGSVVETAAGLATDALPPCYTINSTAKGYQMVEARPITRPHLEGINMYSAQDVLVQSADHQIYNSGGMIELTANHAIRLKVGASSITISESGIEIRNATGTMRRPGALAAFHPADEGEKGEFVGTVLPMSGSITVDGYGVSTTGPNIVNKATNNFCANTLMGSIFRLSDFGATLNAPELSMTGGASALDAVTSGYKKILPALESLTGQPSKGDSAFAAYNGTLVDGWKKGNSSALAGIKDTWSVLDGVLGYGVGISDMGKAWSRISIQGSMIKMNAKGMDMSSPAAVLKNGSLKLYDNPLAGFIPIEQRLFGGDWMKKWTVDMAHDSLSTADSVAGMWAKYYTDGSVGSTTFSCEFPTSHPKKKGTQGKDVEVGFASFATGTLGAVAGAVVSIMVKSFFLSRSHYEEGAKNQEILGELKTRIGNCENTVEQQQNQLNNVENTCKENGAWVDSTWLAIEEAQKTAHEELQTAISNETIALASFKAQTESTLKSQENAITSLLLANAELSLKN